MRQPRRRTLFIFHPARSATAEYCDFHAPQPVDAERVRSSARQVDNAPADERPTIVDAHYNALAVGAGHTHACSERQRAMRRGAYFAFFELYEACLPPFL